MQDSFFDDIINGEKLLITLCRQEHQRNLQRQRLRLETWQPDSARKTRVRQFVTLWLDEEPLYIAKIPLSEEDGKVAHEYDILRQFKGLGVRTAEPLCLSGRGFIMRYVAREDLPRTLNATDSPDRWLELVEKVVGQIVVFHSTHLSSQGATKPDELLRSIAGYWEPLQEETRSALASAQVGAAHGDLGPWNIRYDDRSDRISVIDWEDFRPQGLPALDLLNFLFTLPLLVYPDWRTLGFERLYELVFCQYGLASHLIARGLLMYAQAMKVRVLDLIAMLPVYYQAMVARFQSEDRSVADLFYVPFQQWFSMEKIVWLSRLVS